MKTLGWERIHTPFNVWQHMVWVIAKEYPGMDPVTAESLPMRDVLRWYDGLRPTLRERTRPRSKK